MRDISKAVDQAAYEEFLQKRCMGVLTKVDKELEINAKKTATQYNSEAAAKLRESLNCEKHDLHMHKWPWVAVVNPNPEEQQQVRLPINPHDWNVTCRCMLKFFDFV
jgi:hypothetical protein